MGRSTSTGVNRASLRPFVGSGRGCLLMAPGAFNCRGIRESQRRREKNRNKIQNIKTTKTQIVALRISRWNLWGSFHTSHPSIHSLLLLLLSNLTTFISVFSSFLTLFIHPPTRSFGIFLFSFLYYPALDFSYSPKQKKTKTKVAFSTIIGPSFCTCHYLLM